MSATKRLLSPLKLQQSIEVKKPKLCLDNAMCANVCNSEHKDATAIKCSAINAFCEDDGDFIDFAAIDALTASKKVKNACHTIDLAQWQRCVVETVERDNSNYDLVLQVRPTAENDKENSTNPANAALTKCHLQGAWCQVRINVGDIVSLRAIWDAQLQCYKVNNANGFCVNNADLLMSTTSVVAGVFCQRKAVLQERFRGIDANSKVMVIGTLLHELFQTVLRRGSNTLKQIEAAAEQLLQSQDLLFDLYASKLSAAEVRAEVQTFLPNILSVVQQYFQGVQAGVQKVQKDVFQDTVAEIADIEENVWVPQLGLKGKIDVSVRIRRRRNYAKIEENAIPLEVKTGRASFSMEHKGQVMLYQLMLTEAVRTTCSSLLLYLREGLMREISSTRNEQRDLVLLRNELSFYLSHYPTTNVFVHPLLLPPPISHHSACRSCAYNTICCSFAHTDAELQLPMDHPLQKVRQETTTHLKQEDYQYFMHWCGLLCLEEKEAKQSNNLRFLWTETTEFRQQMGRAMFPLQLQSTVVEEKSRFIHTFVQMVEGSQQINDLLISGFTVGEYVIVSSSKRLAVAAGCICELTPKSISINLERNLQKLYANELFTVDKYDSQSGNIFNFTNLALLLDDTEQSAIMRDIVIRKIPPVFGKVLPSIVASKGKEILQPLNVVQRKAVLKALTTQSYMLIKGLPGSGKTQTVVAIVRLLHLLGKSVLITSHTHSAVDNVLMRLKKYELPMLRLGSAERVHPDLLDISEREVIKDCKTEDALASMYASFNIVGVTCLGAAHSIFLHRKYNYCIVDEATQVMQSTVLRPLYFCDRFVLIGDPEQLPPLIRSKEARRRGADESLFQRLDNEQATCNLTLQYRMNKTINKLANDLTYGGSLEGGSQQVNLATMKLPKAVSGEKWLQRSLQMHVEQAVFLLDTLNCAERNADFAEKQQNHSLAKIEDVFADNKPMLPKTKKDKRIFKCTNYCEAAVVLHIIKTLLATGFQSNRIGIIAPYRAQVELLRKLCSNQQNLEESKTVLDFESVEVNTVDQYQGRDKDIIIYCCTKSGAFDASQLQQQNARENEILEDKRRLTVAITRAKHKLLLIGDVACLQQYTPFRALFSRIPSHCRLQLTEGKFEFQWQSLLQELSAIL